MNVTLFGSKVFSDVIKLKWRHTLIRLGPNPVTGVFKRRENRHRHTGRAQGKDETEAGVICLQTEERQEFPATPETKREPWNILS